MNSRRLSILAATVLFLAAGLVEATKRPPQNLQRVGDHWTAWQPPTSFPEGAEIYTIVRGDTLWDLAARFYGNPYLWPQIWERNQYVLDAHWIYPGDPLVVGIEVTPIEELAEAPATAAPVAELPAEPESPFDRAAGAPEALGSEDDIYCAGYVGEEDEEFRYRIVGSEYDTLTPQLDQFKPGRRGYRPVSLETAKVDLALSDIVYVDGGRRGGLTAGSLFTAVRPGRIVQRMTTGEVVGRVYRYLGRVRILSVQEESAIAEIVHSCYPINRFDFLKPFEEQPVPLARRTGMRGVNDPAPFEQLEEGPAIVLAEAGLVSLGQGHLVFIDHGAEHDVTPGDLFTIYRLNRPGIPPLLVGELGVLAVDQRASLAKILESRFTVHVGDRLDPKR